MTFNPAEDFTPEEIALFSDTWSGEDLWFVLHDVKQGDPDCLYPAELKIYERYLQDKDICWTLYQEWAEIAGFIPSYELFEISQYRVMFEEVRDNNDIIDKQSFVMIMAANGVSPRLWYLPQCRAICQEYNRKMNQSLQVFRNQSL